MSDIFSPDYRPSATIDELRAFIGSPIHVDFVDFAEGKLEQARLELEDAIPERASDILRGAIEVHRIYREFFEQALEEQIEVAATEEPTDE